MKKLKQRLQNGATLHGCWLNMGSSFSAEIVGKSGFDWVLVDLEHGIGTEKDALHQFQALEPTSAGAITRIEGISRPRTHRILDMGAEGIMFPQIRTEAEAKEAIASMRYPPDGVRGMALSGRATGFGSQLDEYYQHVNENLLGIIQIETLESLKNLDAIAAIDGVDVLFIGPADLTLSLGIFRQFDHPHYQDALKATAAAAEKAGKATGILMADPSQYEMYYKLGFRFLACGSESSFVSKAALNMAAELYQHRTKLEN
jgi:4-hydroxy-2-oxoheptanedioate aldolase